MEIIPATAPTGRQQMGKLRWMSVTIIPPQAVTTTMEMTRLTPSDEADIMLSVMYLDNQEPSYDGYDFSQPTAIASGATTTTKTHKTYIEAAQGQGSPPSPPDAEGRSEEWFNQYNCYISVWYVLLDNQYMVYVFINTYLLNNIWQSR